MLTEAARIMGLVVIGAMMASMVNVNLVMLNINGAQVVLQEIFDAICRKFCPGPDLACYWGCRSATGTVIMIAAGLGFWLSH
ncbi:MAG: PTS system mannose/fructose/sorbose family transporter subunit IID [Holdemania massiliensis]